MRVWVWKKRPGVRNMDFKPHLKSYWSQFFCNQPQMEFDVRMDYHLLSRELKSSCVQLEEHPDSYGNIWTDSELVKVKKCHGRSFALDARMRLDSLKSGFSSPNCGVDIKLFKYNSDKDLWGDEDSQTGQSALDLVEILDIDDNIQDEESWLYEPQNKQVFVEKESALSWCRHVLDNPSPEVEAARRGLMNKLDQRSRYDFYERAAVSQHPPRVSPGSNGDETLDSTSRSDSGSLDHNESNLSSDSITTSYRLQDITDVHIMARIQEDSLRQEYVSTPAAAPLRRNPEMLLSYLNTKVETEDFAPAHQTKPSSSTCWQPDSESLSPCCYEPLTSASRQGCQSPKLNRLHQQVTQFKLLRLAQNQGASPDRTRSPLRTSLRSLQAVRNSRSLETDDYQPSGQATNPPAGVSSAGFGSGCGSPSLSAAPLKSNNSIPTSAQITALRRLQRSQSLSPSRIAHPVKGYLSARGRVFASPERQSSAAWGRHAPSVQR